jgi:putative endonuclease
MKKKNCGHLAEQFACSYLKKQGLSLIVRNYRCRFGEIDLIMQERAQIVFIEVRYRGHSTFGRSIETIDHAKQARLLKTAEHYLQQHTSYDEPSCRFDVMGLSPITTQNHFSLVRASLTFSAQVEWIKNAFSR